MLKIKDNRLEELVKLGFKPDKRKNVLYSNLITNENGEYTFKLTDTLGNIATKTIIINKIDLPNGKTRVIIKGLNRAYIHEYLNIGNDNLTVLNTSVSHPYK